MTPATLTDRFWQNIAPILDAILAHPFIKELSDGSLSRDRFIFYLQQDALYLQDFARALGLAGVRSPDTATVQAFLNFGSGAISVEHTLHESYFEEFGASKEGEKAPACFAYTSFLLSTAAVGSYAEAVAALLPCFWIYREVGKHIYKQAEVGLANNPYRRWIETYSGDSYAEAVDKALAITNQIGLDRSLVEQERMAKAFLISARLEWMFWDSAYQLEEWPPK